MPGRSYKTALLAHRYVGLFLVVFLVTAGLTGTLIAFFDELDAWVIPELHELPRAERSRPTLDPFEIAEQVDRAMPAGRRFRSVRFDVAQGRTIPTWVEESPGEWREWFVSPKTGEVVGKRDWGELSEGRKNLMPFIYRLHYSLGLGEVGSLLFGIAALLWTLDCFVGAYLAFPKPSRGESRSRASFFRRWLPAWMIRTNQLFAFVFTFHRASGLWVWALLFVFAWSAVRFNLPQVYTPVMQTLAGVRPEGHELLPHLTQPFPEPRLSLREVHERGKIEMARAAKERGFSIVRERGIYYADDHGAFTYTVESSLDVSKTNPRTEIYLDGQTGRVLGFSAPTGLNAGNTFSNWIVYLHMGHVFGLWYRVVVALLGLVVAGLSVTGVWIWWRKRTKRGRAKGDRTDKTASEDIERRGGKCAKAGASSPIHQS